MSPRAAAILLISAVVAFGLGACHKAPQPTQSAATAAATVTTPPPPLPIYAQPPIPADGYVWTPGYWAWNDGVGDYYWVPGTWVQPPQQGLLWTPGYWAFQSGRYAFNPGYWGSRVGFYGGIDYGYGYSGSGYQGGRWQGDSFYYNTTVNNVANAPIRHAYRQTVVEDGASVRESFNGGGGRSARASPAELAATQAARVPPTPIQAQHVQLARTTPGLRASVNHGRPIIAATPRPAVFQGPDVVTSVRTAAAYSPPPAMHGPGPQRQAMIPAAMPTRSATSPPNLQARPMERSPPPHPAAAPAGPTSAPGPRPAGPTAGPMEPNQH